MFASVGTRPGRRSLRAEQFAKNYDEWRAFLQSMGFRDVASSDREYFVRPDGNDENDGWGNSPARAFKTLQRAVDEMASIDLASHQGAITAGAGTYTDQVHLRSFLGAGPVNIKGDETTPSNVVIQPSSHINTEGIFHGDGVVGLYVLSGMKLTSSALGGHGIIASGCKIAFKKMDFGALGTGGYQLSADSNGTIEARDDYTISGGADRHVQVLRSGVVKTNAYGTTTVDVTLSGTPAFATAFATAQDLGMFRGASSYTGSATGKRYDVTGNAVIRTQGGGGANDLPGNVAGTFGTGGQYL